MNDKILLSQWQIDLLRIHATEMGHSHSWFEQWLSDNVLVVNPLPRPWWKKLLGRW